MDLSDHEQTKKQRIVYQSTKLDNLPREIIADILSRLPITSLVQFKFVCRSWNSLSQDSLVISTATSTTKNRRCLLLHCDFPLRNELQFVDLSDKKVRKFNVPFKSAMPEFDLIGSCNGLLCLSDSLYKDAIYVYNPFTRTHIELPKSTHHLDQEIVYGFGHHPKTKEYKVVKIVYYRSGSSKKRSGNIINRPLPKSNYTQSEVQVLTLGSQTWRNNGKAPYNLVRGRPSGPLINGRLHYVTCPRRHFPTRRLVSFDIEDETFGEVPESVFHRSNYHLAEYKGCLGAIVYGNYGKLDIWVMKEYNVKESWVKEISVGTYLPKTLKQTQQVDRSLKLWKMGGKIVRFLCELENGEILLEYKNRVVVSYDPSKRRFNDVLFQGMPNWFYSITHSPSFNWIDAAPQDF